MQRFAVCLASALVVFSGADILLQTAYHGSSNIERFLCRFYVCASDQLLLKANRQLQYAHTRLYYPVAEFEEALRRDPAYPYRWCDVGAALLAAGDTAKARECFSRGVERGPNSPPILMRAARFSLDTRDKRQALQYMSKILQMTPAYDQQIFRSYTRAAFPAEEVLHYGLPEDRRAVQSYLEYALSLPTLEHAEKSWNWAVSRSFADDRLAGRYLDTLLKHREYDKAAQAWARFAGTRRADYLNPNVLYNGDFEEELTATPLDWNTTESEHVQAARDSTVAHSGKWSLQFIFDGKANVSYNSISQLAVVRPGRYRFEAYVKTEAITTDQGLAFRIFAPESPGRLDVKTQQISGTNDWIKIENAFVVPAATKLIKLEVIRQPTWKFDDKISGTAWIDSLQIVPFQREAPLP